MVQEVRNIRREVLPNGLILITEEMEHIRSASIGIWVKTGSRDEDLQWNGISHFIEHMVFKGTKHRSAEKIAREVDSIGGNMDAFTAKECIGFNIKVLDEHLPIAMDVLSDLVLNPIFDVNDIGRERGVILEEIKMDEDNPDYLVHEIFTQNFWKDHPLGKPILGTKDTVKKFERDPVLDFYKQRFAPGNMIISAAGHLKHEQFVELVAKHFAHMKPVKNGFHSSPPKIVPRIIMRNKKSLEQVQICVGVPSHPHRSRKPSCFLHIEYLARGRHELAAVPEYSRTPGPGLRHLQRSVALPRYRMSLGLCRNIARVRGESRAVDCLRVPQTQA